MAEIKVDLSGTEAALNKIVMIAFRAIDNFWKVAEEAVTELYSSKLEANVSLRDHTLKELARMNPPHPYARKYGSIQNVGHDSWKVHEQSGGIFRNIKYVPDRSIQEVKQDVINQAVQTGGVVKSASAIFSPGALGSVILRWNVVGDSEIVKYLYEGTTKMLPRDFAEETAKESVKEMGAFIAGKFRVAR
jgi:hypothetical protein